MRDVENKFYKEHTSIDFFSETANKTVKIYNIKGEGSKILFVHGWSSRASKFHKIISEFKSKILILQQLTCLLMANLCQKDATCLNFVMLFTTYQRIMGRMIL